ncbi:hypothetical protein GCM10008932_24050 [Alkalibacterium iburiense]|uniref:Uncharacterized protein n=1 Tax=Alkalibacterium iburiense TaxID=290589 RepID=A0ABN0XSW4_9LACT
MPKHNTTEKNRLIKKALNTAKKLSSKVSVDLSDGIHMNTIAKVKNKIIERIPGME